MQTIPANGRRYVLIFCTAAFSFPSAFHMVFLMQTSVSVKMRGSRTSGQKDVSTITMLRSRAGSISCGLVMWTCFTPVDLFMAKLSGKWQCSSASHLHAQSFHCLGTWQSFRLLFPSSTFSFVIFISPSQSSGDMLPSLLPQERLMDNLQDLHSILVAVPDTPCRNYSSLLRKKDRGRRGCEYLQWILLFALSLGADEGWLSISPGLSWSSFLIKGKSFIGTPTRQVENGFSGSELDKYVISEPAAWTEVTNTFVFGCSTGKPALQETIKTNQHYSISLHPFHKLISDKRFSQILQFKNFDVEL